MRMIPIKKGLFALLILEAAIISLASIGFMIKLYKTYTAMVYSESAEVLNLNATITDAKLSEIENLSFEVLSNQDIQSNLWKYTDYPHSYDAYKAADDLYTQLFTRWIMNKNVLSISFVFLDGKRVDAGHLQSAHLSGSALNEIIEAAARANGSCGWAANAAGDNVVTLYRLIKDISGNNRFRPLGTLIINVDGNYLLGQAPAVSAKYSPDIICLAGDQILSKDPLDIKPDEILSHVDGAKNYDIISIDGEPSVVSIKRLDYENWYLVYILSARALLSSITNVNLIYIAALLLVVFAVTAIGYKFADAISKPITQLTRSMKVVEENDYACVQTGPLPEPRLAIAEVVQLSRDFTQMVQQIDHLINEVYVKQLLIMEMKYKMLQQQINPHFLYNTLDTINWKAVQSGNKDISVMVKSLSKLLRGSIKGPDIITLREDLCLVEDYIKIQKIRFEERLDFKVDILPELHACRIPRLTLQPIVENSIIHNLEKYSGIYKIYVAADLSDGRLRIAVEDTGRGVDLQHMEKVLSGQIETNNNSIGLKNIDQRIKMAFGESFGISVENNEPTGARVIVLLPYEGELDEDVIDSR